MGRMMNEKEPCPRRNMTPFVFRLHYRLKDIFAPLQILMLSGRLLMPKWARTALAAMISASLPSQISGFSESSAMGGMLVVDMFPS